MAFLEATYEVGDHLPRSFGVGSEALLLALLGKLKLSFSFGFFLFLVPFCYLEKLLAFTGSFFHKVFRASFLRDIIPMKVCSEAVN
jgi:hypothetical protein